MLLCWHNLWWLVKRNFHYWVTDPGQVLYSILISHPEARSGYKYHKQILIKFLSVLKFLFLWWYFIINPINMTHLGMTSQPGGSCQDILSGPESCQLWLRRYCWSEGLTQPSQWRCHQDDAPNITKLFCPSNKNILNCSWICWTVFTYCKRKI